MTGRLLWVLVFGLTVLVHALPISAQEPPRVQGVTLPPSHYERISRQPDLYQIKDGWIARAERASAMSMAVSDTLRVAVILALFADSPEPHITHVELQRVLFDGPYEHGTASEYYEEASGGRFALRGEILPWVRTSLTMETVVGDEYGLGGDARTHDYLVEAIELADPNVDFGLFDNDGPDGRPNSGDDDGAVDAVAFEFLEVAASCGGPSIWPHRSRIEWWQDSAHATGDLRPNGEPIVVNDYIVQSVVDCGGSEPQKATTIAHEMGHVLGLPDLYDRSQGILPEERRWVIGCWSLMAAGAWGCGADDRSEWLRPTHPGAWEKIRLGWLDEVAEAGIGIDLEYTLEPVISGQRVLKIPLEGEAVTEESEYLLIEYRTRQGFDADLPASGVLVYHVDPRIPGNQPCSTCAQVYRVGVLEADTNNSLRRTFLEGGNRGEAGDAWTVTRHGMLASNTDPSTRLNSGAPTSVTIYDISIEGGSARIALSTSRIADSRLVQSFLGSSAAPLTVGERNYLDRYGNGNGEYDVGDLRAYLRR